MPWFLPDYLQISQLHIHSSNNTIHNRSVSHWTAFKFIQPFLQIDWYGELFWAGWYKQTTMTNHIIGSNREQKRTQIWSKTSDNTVVQPTRGLYSIFENNRDPWEGGQGKVLQPEYEMSQQTLTTNGYLKSCHQVVVPTFYNNCHDHSSSLACSHLNDKLGVPFQMYISSPS